MNVINSAIETAIANIATGEAAQEIVESFHAVLFDNGLCAAVLPVEYRMPVVRQESASDGTQRRVLLGDAPVRIGDISPDRLTDAILNAVRVYLNDGRAGIDKKYITYRATMAENAPDKTPLTRDEYELDVITRKAASWVSGARARSIEQEIADPIEKECIVQLRARGLAVPKGTKGHAAIFATLLAAFRAAVVAKGKDADSAEKTLRALAEKVVAERAASTDALADLM